MTCDSCWASVIKYVSSHSIVNKAIHSSIRYDSWKQWSSKCLEHRHDSFGRHILPIAWIHAYLIYLEPFEQHLHQEWRFPVRKIWNFFPYAGHRQMITIIFRQLSWAWINHISYSISFSVFSLCLVISLLFIIHPLTC